MRAWVAVFAITGCAGHNLAPVRTTDPRIARADQLLATIEERGRIDRKGIAGAELVAAAIVGVSGGAILSYGTLDGPKQDRLETSAAITGGVCLAVAALALGDGIRRFAGRSDGEKLRARFQLQVERDPDVALAEARPALTAIARRTKRTRIGIGIGALSVFGLGVGMLAKGDRETREVSIVPLLMGGLIGLPMLLGTSPAERISDRWDLELSGGAGAGTRAGATTHPPPAPVDGAPGS